MYVALHFIDRNLMSSTKSVTINFWSSILSCPSLVPVLGTSTKPSKTLQTTPLPLTLDAPCLLSSLLHLHEFHIEIQLQWVRIIMHDNTRYEGKGDSQVSCAQNHVLIHFFTVSETLSGSFYTLTIQFLFASYLILYQILYQTAVVSFSCNFTWIKCSTSR